jgi:hypothetical protein
MPSPTSTISTPTEAAIQFLRDLASHGFWGILTIKLQHGDVVHITREESIPAEKLIPNLRSNHDNNSK